jgi:hypothetical protein
MAMALPRPSGPRALWADLKAFTAERSRHQWVAMFLAVAMPLGIVIVFLIDGRTNIAPGEQIIYVESWSSNRTDAEIVADQKKDKANKEAAAKERQRQFQELERRFGMK